MNTLSGSNKGPGIIKSIMYVSTYARNGWRARPVKETFL